MSYSMIFLVFFMGYGDFGYVKLIVGLILRRSSSGTYERHERVSQVQYYIEMEQVKA